MKIGKIVFSITDTRENIVGIYLTQTLIPNNPDTFHQLFAPSNLQSWGSNQLRTYGTQYFQLYWKFA